MRNATDPPDRQVAATPPIPSTRLGRLVDVTMYRIRSQPGQTRKAHRRLRIAAAGYLVVLIFAASFLIISDLNAHWRNEAFWPTLSRVEVVLVAVLAALPVALAFIWDRLTTIRLAGFEVSLAASAPKTSDQLRDELKDAQRFPLGGSGYPDIKTAIRNATGDLIEINVGDSEWWSTRLYLIAALAQDYTSVKQLLFVDRCDSPRVCFIGFSTPAATRRDLAAVHPNLERDGCGEMARRCLSVRAYSE